MIATKKKLDKDSKSNSSEKVPELQMFNLFIDELTVLDCACLDPLRGPVGQSFHIDAELVGSLDEDGVIFDFSEAKKAIKQFIDQHVDHRLIVPAASLKKTKENKWVLDFSFGNRRHLNYECPEEAICAIDAPSINTATIQTYLEKMVMSVLPKNVQSLKLHVRNESLADDQPHYHYTHGLKKHDGNCQRLLHGHRNKIDVFVDGFKNYRMEELIAREWNDVHLTFPENVTGDTIRPGIRQHHLEQVHISYESSQGLFNLSMPGKDVYVMPYETTVENISLHLAEKISGILKAEGKLSRVRVHAYEGIRKGSIVEN